MHYLYGKAYPIRPNKMKEVIHIWLCDHLGHLCRVTNRIIPMSVDQVMTEVFLG